MNFREDLARELTERYESMSTTGISLEQVFGQGPAPDPNIISVVTGRANMRTATTEFFVFFTPVRDIRGSVETFIGKACRELQGFTDSPIRQHGGVETIPALNDTPADIGGTFATCSYAIRDGVILKIMAKRRNGVNQPMITTVQYVRCRKSAAHRTIALTCVPNNRLNLAAMEIRGNFDLVSPDEVVALGGSVNPLSRNMAEHGQEILRYTEQAPEIVAPVVHEEVETSKGESMIIPVQQRKRRIER